MKHLFIDDQVVEEIDNLARKLHQPRKYHGNAVLRPEHRWENASIQIRTTPGWVPEEGVFKMLYFASAAPSEAGTGGPPGDGSFICYATSEDGVNWEKPFLGLHDYEARLWTGEPVGGQNNIVPTGSMLAPVYDPGDPDPQRRYKGMGWRKGAAGLVPMVSPDCLRWRYLDVEPVPSSDEAHFSFDGERRLFIATVKHGTPEEGSPYGRCFSLSTSEDFEHWSRIRLVFHADQTDQENGVERLARFFADAGYLTPLCNRPEEYRTDVYNFPVFRYEGLYLGLPVMHHWAGKHPPMYENVDSRKSVELACSRDLLNWERVANRAPFMELSPVGDGSAYDTGQIVVTNGPVARNNELWFYYLGLRHRCLSPADRLAGKGLDTGAVCMAKLRMDGFVSLKGGIEWGSVLTKPLMVEGDELRVNVDSWRGRLRAEILDASDGQPIRGYTREDSIAAVIDSIDEPLRWRDRADVGELRGRTVRIRFSLWQAELYGFWFADRQGAGTASGRA